jgi:hypothetical protein
LVSGRSKAATKKYTTVNQENEEISRLASWKPID